MDQPLTPEDGNIPDPSESSDLTSSLSQKHSRAECPLRLLQTRRGGTAKLEYFLGMIIRGFRKAVKAAKRLSIPSSRLFLHLSPSSPEWAAFLDVVHRFKQLIHLSAIYGNPEGWMPNWEAGQFKSFSKGYRRAFFDNPYLRIVFAHFCDALFMGTPDQLCRAMQVRCCPDLVHQEECSNVRHFVQIQSVEELGLEAYRLGAE